MGWVRAFFATALVAGSAAHGQIYNTRDTVFREPAEAPRPMGWQKSGTANANLSFTSSEGVVGQTSGTSQTYGLNLKGHLGHLAGNREWRIDVNLREATTRTPSVPRFIKSDDELKMTATYLHSLPGHPDLGPYARAEAAAPVFKGEDVRAEAKVYRVKFSDPANERVLTATSLRLTDPFKPLATKEGTGLFYRPVREERIQIETRLGFAAQQVSAAGQFSVKGLNSAGEVQIEELNDVRQAGVEAGLAVKGKVDEKSTFELGADTLTPFINNRPAGDRRDAWRLTNIEGFAKIVSRITDWASFGYDYKLKVQPQLVDRAQQIHMIVLTFNYPVNPGAP